MLVLGCRGRAECEERTEPLSHLLVLHSENLEHAVKPGREQKVAGPRRELGALHALLGDVIEGVDTLLGDVARVVVGGPDACDDDIWVSIMCCRGIVMWISLSPAGGSVHGLPW